VNRKVAIAAVVVLAICLILTGVVCRRKRSAPKPPQVNVEAGAKSIYKTAVSLQSKGRLEEAVKAYQELIKQFPEFKQISEAEKKLWDANVEILFSPVVTDKDIRYKVKPGDTLGKIAAGHNTTVDLIKRSNNLESDLIRPGQRFKISTAKYSVIVDKSQNSLALKADDKIFKVYSVATGEYNCTPVGTFTIVEKLINPDWYKSGPGAIPAASPENILGTRWMSLSDSDYGIHGGASEKDLGSQVTNGCIRMTDAGVEELFAILPRGTEVTIVE